jgi:hypothetical protein
MSLLETIDSSHILDKISKIPPGLITEIIIIIFVINLVFSLGYYQLYLNDVESFKNIHYQDKSKPKPIEYFDFVYYSNTLFFSLGYDIVPQTKCTKFFTMLHMKLGFIITTIFIAKIVSSC